MSLVYIIAGEASGDLIGARLIDALREQRLDLDVCGIGGAAMAARGVVSLFPMRELALMGLVEVLPNLLRLRARLAQTVADIAARRPSVLVTIDSPGFTLRVLRRVAPLGIRRVHYVAPQVWAWREGRVRHFPGLWDELLCLLPFEPEFFARHNLPARFVGHPVLESALAAGDAARFRAAHGLAAEARVLLLMPGSRRSEIARHAPLFAATLARLATALPGLVPVVPVAETVAGMEGAALAGWSPRPILLSGEAAKADALAAARASAGAALVKSGTATLEVALAGVAQIVTYRMNPLTAALARRLIRVRHASLVNLLAGREILPEYLQDRATPDALAAGLLPLLTDPAAAQAQRDAAAAPLALLRAPDGLSPSQAAAAAVLRLLDRG